jgi:hypothetical protein
MSRPWLVIASVAVTAITAAVVVAVPVTPDAQASDRLFTGDYSTGDFSQWPDIGTIFWGDPATGYLKSTEGYQPAYPAAVVPDPVKGLAARYEVRSGDVTDGKEASQVTASAADTGGTEGQIRWYAFSTKFDPTFPMDHASLGWGLTNQWHEGSDMDGSPPFGMYVDQLNGNWSLTIQKQSSPGVYQGVFPIWNTPLDRGNWHDIKMEIMYSTSDATGYIRLWHNGIRQKFLNGTDTYFVRTLIPGTTTVYYKEGYYRERMAPTGIVYQSGFRVADSESGL